MNKSIFKSFLYNYWLFLAVLIFVSHVTGIQISLFKYLLGVIPKHGTQIVTSLNFSLIPLVAIILSLYITVSSDKYRKYLLYYFCYVLAVHFITWFILRPADLVEASNVINLYAPTALFIIALAVRSLKKKPLYQKLIRLSLFVLSYEFLFVAISLFLSLLQA